VVKIARDVLSRLYYESGYAVGHGIFVGMAAMEDQLHAAGERAGSPHHKNVRRRAGLPAKRFFTRYAGLADVPAEDLESLSRSLRKSLDLDPGSRIPALQALVRRELRGRGDSGA
jgi:uncharacterized protein YceH (UPF0502 family)